MPVYMIKGESVDYCGISEIFVFHSPLLDSREALDTALLQYGDNMDEALYEYYDEEEEEGNYTYSIEEWSDKEYGPYNNDAYISLNKPLD